MKVRLAILISTLCISGLVSIATAAEIQVNATALVPGKDITATILVEPKSVLADGQSQLAVLVFVNNSEGEPLADKTITLTTSRPDKDTIEETTPTTTANGVAIFKLKSQFTGQTNITASLGDTVIGTAQATFFSRSRAFFLTSSPLIAIAGLFIAFEFFRWLWLLGFWRRDEEKHGKVASGWHSRY